MIEEINNNQVPDILKESSAMQPNSSNTPANDQIDASLQVSYDSLIEQAAQIPPEDISVVQRAHQLLSSGQLESPENIRAAAEIIVTFDI
jgi:hypothetical protein